MKVKNKKVILKRTKSKATQRVRPPRPAERVRPAQHVASADVAAAAEREEQRDPDLDADVFELRARKGEAILEFGRVLIKLKKILGSSKFRRFLVKPFVPGGLTLREAENYMRMAREADSEIDRLLRGLKNVEDLT